MTEFYEIDESGATKHIRTLSQADMARCPFLIMLPEHYRDDGTCKCNCSTERERMIREWGYTAAHFREAGLIP